MSAIAMQVVPRGMPKKLADAGWELLESDAPPRKYRAFNEELDVNLGPYPNMDEAQAAAYGFKSDDAEPNGAAAVEEVEERKCRVCGCTDSNACEGGCTWVAEDLCSVCQANGIIAEAKASPAAERTAEVSREPMPALPYTGLLDADLIFPEVALRMRADGLNMLKVAEYKEAMLDGAEFPPVDVFYDYQSDIYLLAGGAHRLQATLDAELTEILANVRAGTKRDALIWAAGENKTHGLPRTNADKHIAVEALLRDSEWVSEADSVIAKHAGVSQPFVSGLREELELKTVISPQPMRRGADGVVRDVSKIGSRVEEETADDRQTTLADVGVELPPRETEFQEETEDALATQSPRQNIVGDWTAADVVDALNRHGGVLYRGQLEEMGCGYGALLSAVNEGAILQPEIGKFTLPDHKPQPGATADRRPETAAPSKPKPSIEELVRKNKVAMLQVSFAWLPAVKGKVNVTVNTGTDKTKALRRLVDAEEVRGFSQSVMNLIFDRMTHEPPVKAKDSGAKRSKKPTKRPAPKKKVASKKPAKKKARR